MSALISSGVLAGGGYLAQVGPSPLRFRVTRARLDPGTALPALSAAEVQTNQALVATNTAVSGVEPPVQPLGPARTNELWLGPDPLTMDHPQGAGQDTNSIPAQPGVSPQMFLRFFNRDSGREAIVTTPLEFTPPTPANQPGSSAIYLSPP